jgi:hypothetical protein
MSADLLTTVEAADVLGRDPGTLANWRSFRKGPKFVRVKEGDRVYIRYRRTDLESFRQRNGKPS